jgi:hypothetical protein
MKKILFLLALAILPLIGEAQEKSDTVASDTTVIIKGRKYVIREADKKLNIQVYGKTQRGDTIKDDMVYEATYNDEQTTERRFTFSTPFNKQRVFGFEPHNAGIYVGYAQLTDNVGPWRSCAIDLRNAASWEIGFNLISGHKQLSASGHWGVTASVGWGVRWFRLDCNEAFRRVDGSAVVQSGSDENKYSESRLICHFMRFPFCLEWQTKGGGLFASAGVEPEWRYCVKSKAKVNGGTHTLEHDMYVNTVGLNALLQAGYEDFGFYLRCSMTRLFESNKGPKCYPFSFGLVWYW